MLRQDRLNLGGDFRHDTSTSWLYNTHTVAQLPSAKNTVFTVVTIRNICHLSKLYSVTRTRVHAAVSLPVTLHVLTVYKVLCNPTSRTCQKLPGIPGRISLRSAVRGNLYGLALWPTLYACCLIHTSTIAVEMYSLWRYISVIPLPLRGYGAALLRHP